MILELTASKEDFVSHAHDMKSMKKAVDGEEEEEKSFNKDTLKLFNVYRNE